MSDDSLHEKAGEIFLTAIEKPATRRDSYVEIQCAGNQELLKEVQSLLEYHEDDAGPDDKLDTIAKHLADQRADIPIDELGEEAPSGPISKTSVKKRFTTRVLTGKIVSRVFGSKYRRIVTNSLLLLVFSIFGYTAHKQIESSISTFIKNDLETVIHSKVMTFDIWAKDRIMELEIWASKPGINKAALSLINDSHGKNEFTEHWSHPSNQYLLKSLDNFMEVDGIVGFSVVDRTNRIVGHWAKVAMGASLGVTAATHFALVMEGESKFRIPYRSSDWYGDEDSILGQARLVWFDTPIYDQNGQAQGVFSFAYLADGMFNQIISKFQQGKTGETYAFDKNGLLLSPTRFDSELKELGRLGDQSYSALNLIATPKLEDKESHQLVEPLVGLLNGINRESKLSVQSTLSPYIDIRGKKVIGAWQWLEEYDFGVITEIEASEAFQSSYLVYTAFLSIYILLLLALIYSVFANFTIIKLRAQILEGRQLGNYTLLDKIGAGGMGDVFLAKHELLKRPTAIKVLKEGVLDTENRARFEGEVQLASGLSNPHTIKIYDYGRTEDDVFYYAMEFLKGITLAELISIETMLSPERTVYILRQACLSLREAHNSGLIHRDIKPLNIMICSLGGEYDFVKILDFGLVKDLERTDHTKTKAIVGTPLFMAPERLKGKDSVDGRVDIYSLGAVAYEMLTGRPVFSGSNDMDLLYDVMNTTPTDLNKYTIEAVPKDLEDLVMTCLSKNPDDRPSDIQSIIDRLDQIQSNNKWSSTKAEKWWTQNIKARRRLEIVSALTKGGIST